MRVKNVLLKIQVPGSERETELWAITVPELNVPVFGQLHLREHPETLYLLDRMLLDHTEKVRVIRDSSDKQRWVRVSGEIQASNKEGFMELSEEEVGGSGQINLEWMFTLIADVIEFVSDHEVESTTE
jgi:hypothetical protein